jgi:hypothetical protein
MADDDEDEFERAIREWSMDFEYIKCLTKIILLRNNCHNDMGPTEPNKADGYAPEHFRVSFALNNGVNVTIIQPYMTETRGGLMEYDGVISTNFKSSKFNHTNIEIIFENVLGDPNLVVHCTQANDTPQNEQPNKENERKRISIGRERIRQSLAGANLVELVDQVRARGHEIAVDFGVPHADADLLLKNSLVRQIIQIWNHSG